MYKKMLLFFLMIVLISCNDNKEIYNKNLVHFKMLVHDLNTYFSDSLLVDLQISNYYTEDFIFYSFPAGNRKGIETSKEDYINGFKEMKDIDMCLDIIHSIYLPGINEHSHDLDGSVRVYYGAIISMVNDSVEFSGYQTVNFEEGKISAIWEWADYGGVNNQISETY